MTMRERFEKWWINSLAMCTPEYVAELSWRDAEKQFHPPKPTPEQLAAAGVRLVGEEPCMVMPGEQLPALYWSFYGLGVQTGDRNHQWIVPVFVWRVERV